jgi:hypothetical protein
MHLSTSSSSERVPQGGWLRTWVVTFIVVAVVVAGWEWFVRTRGLGDVAIANTAEPWIRERERAAELGDNALVLIGASRMQGGLDLETFQAITKATPVQLAISASPFMPVLRHLADDPAITGTIVVSFDMSSLRVLDEGTDAQRWVAAYDDFKAGRTAVFYQPVEDWLHQGVDSMLVSFSRNARPHQLVLARTTKSYVRTLPDRSQQFDYSKIDREEAYERRVRLVLDGTDPSFLEISDIGEKFADIERQVEKLQARGAEVIFVRFPSSKRIREIEDIRFPRDVYWDKLAAGTSARTIHFADYPELGNVDLPDGVHPDVSEQKKFTEALARILFGGDLGRKVSDP